MKKGFSILELVIVVVMLGIIAGFAVPSLSGLTEERNVKITANNLALYINKIRTCVNATGIPVTLTLDKTGAITTLCCSECASFNEQGICTKCTDGKDVRSNFEPQIYDSNTKKFAGADTGVSDSNVKFKRTYKSWDPSSTSTPGSLDTKKSYITYIPSKLRDYTTAGGNGEFNRMILTDNKAGDFSCTIDITPLGLAEVSCE